MPIYEYECLKCGDVREIFQKFNDAPLSTCSKCNGDLRKIISNTSFILKGTGWYKTDYATDSKKSKESDKKTESKSDTKTENKTEAKAETKTETNTEAASKA